MAEPGKRNILSATQVGCFWVLLVPFLLIVVAVETTLLIVR